MRRWFAIVLLALLPLQFSWAAVSAYCAHEADAQGGHLGHHPHPPHAAAGDADDGGASGKAPVKAGQGHDCGHCHGCVAALPGPDGTPPLFATAEVRTAPVAQGTRSLAPTPPERPQWHALA
jgi:hypothetical protein